MKNNYKEVAKEIKEIDEILGNQFLEQKNLLIDALTEELQTYLEEKRNKNIDKLYRPLDDLLRIISVENLVNALTDQLDDLKKYLEECQVDRILVATESIDLGTSQREIMYSTYYRDCEYTRARLLAFFLED